MKSCSSWRPQRRWYSEACSTGTGWAGAWCAPGPALPSEAEARSSLYAEPPRPVGHDVKQPAHHGDVLHEHRHLALLLGCRGGPEVVKDERHRDHPQKKRSGPEPRLPADDQHQRRADLDDDAENQQHLDHRQPLGRHKPGCLGEAADLAESRQQENHGEQEPPRNGSELGDRIVHRLAFVGGASVHSERLNLQIYICKSRSERVIIGTSVMGADPSTSVVNKYPQSWDVPNVFVVGASAFRRTAATTRPGPWARSHSTRWTRSRRGI